MLLGISVWQKGHLSDALEVSIHNCMAGEDSDWYHQAFPVKLSVVDCVDLHEIRPLRSFARSQCFSRILGS